jgi:hypothetical protein
MTIYVPGSMICAIAIDADQEIHLYKSVSALTREFLAVEGQSFDMI